MTQPVASSIRIGTILRDTYELVSELGRGGMGTVFLAQHLRLPGKQVAVKVLHAQEETSPEVYARFRREAEITSRLGHPNIVAVFDFHSLEDGTPYLVMEHLRGESLSKRLRQGAIPLQEALLIARQIGSALHTAHQAGVVHRDLKPGNVYLVPTESGGVVGQQVKLLDFGISKLASAQTVHTKEDVLLGTPRYMSPEQAMGKNREVDARSDLFALGCIVYEMLTGRPPFNGDSVAGLIYNIVYQPPDALGLLCPDVPPSVIAAVDRALSKDPKDRFPDVASFIAELTGTPLQSLPPSQPQPTARPEATPRAPGSPSSFPTRRADEPANTVPGRRPTTQPQAEVPGNTVPLGPTVQPKSKVPLIAGGVAVLLVAVAAAGWWLRPQTPPAPAVSTPESTAKAEPPPKPATPPPAVVTAPAETPPTGSEPSESAPSEQVAATTTAETRPTPRTTARQGPPEVMPEEVRKDLTDAEQALKDGNAAEAIRLARRSQRMKITGASFSVLTRAHCHQSDLANARAQWAKVPSAERTRVRQYCKQYEINL
ncbi:protein kinase [Archangium violaceum]|uniref:serine/threonine-protein kinase n=1 Tax=Archangium violaceum TaxID=83451 RepID=UPI00194F8400|nr:serine/threonine-protein kinase [Archangium violaceum]QRN99537.1 protein kinase [Archangium violaceum]